jgi:hypothetical protein
MLLAGLLRRQLDIRLRQISVATRKELLAAVIARYRTAPAAEKVRILDEFTASRRRLSKASFG